MELKAVVAGASRKCCTQRTRLNPQYRITSSITGLQVPKKATQISCSSKSPLYDSLQGTFLRCQPRTLHSRASREGATTKTNASEEKNAGTVMGATSLIIGTSVGSGILALPQKTSSAGFIPSIACVIVSWAFLVVEALLIAEVNVSLRRMRMKSSSKNKEAEDEKEEEASNTVMSFKTMADETLGEVGGSMANIIYIFLGYTTMIAYVSQSGELLSQLITLPPYFLSILFTSMLSSLIFLGGTSATDRVNQWLTALMLGLLVAIEVTAASSGDWIGLMETGDWTSVPKAFPIIIFSLVYHDVIPVICDYLDGDLKRIRLSILVGSLIPLVLLLVWDGIVLGYSSQIDGTDPLQLLFRDGGAAVSTMAEIFSMLAIGTSLIGTLLAFSSFFHEQFYSLFRSYLPSLAAQIPQGNKTPIESSDGDAKEWFDLESMLNFSSVAVAVIPSLVLSITIADAFSVATDIAGGYCMILLYGIMPPAMAWSLRMQEVEETP